MGRLLAALAVLIVVASAFVVPRLREFRVDASTESLVREEDPAARVYDATRLLFTSDEFVLVGLTRDDLFTPEGVAAVASLHARFAAIKPGVQDVQSLSSVPLLRSFKRPVQPFMAVAKKATIHSPEVDLERARAELTQHELYAGNLVSRDGRTAGILVTFEATQESLAAAGKWLVCQADVAAASSALAGAPPAGKVAAEAALADARARAAAYKPEYVAAEDRRKDERLTTLRAIREVVDGARGEGADVQVSGVPSIVVEMVEAIQRDLETFSILSVAFILGFLVVVFRRAQWVLLPLLPVGATVLWTIAYMLSSGKRMTVITGNVPSLLLAIGISHSIHMIVRWREYLVRFPDDAPDRRALRVARSLAWPCFFSASTTMVGFVSLGFTGSRPIIDFGVLMAIGVGSALLLSFVIMPGALSVLPVKAEGRLERSARLLERLVTVSVRRRAAVALLTLALATFGILGLLRLDVEARFIDYFRAGSPIHVGLTYVDEHLGGTSGLEVVITGETGAFGPAHQENLDQAEAVARWLRDRSEVGVVMSYTGILAELRKLSPEKIDRRGAAFLLGTAIDRGAIDPGLIDDYVVVKPVEVEGRTVGPFSTVRIVARVRETDPTLRRIPLLHELQAFLAAEFPADGPLRAEATGMFVLYANMLESLMGSQLSSSLLCLVAIWLMLAALFRSLLAPTLALLPNLLPISLALGVMGWAGIPLDMATVMIASVTLGIGIDSAIHYLFRYEDEVRRGGDGDLQAALERTSGSIGTSIFYTALTAVVGFAVLALSEFRPNAYFGVLTGLAMIAALFAMLTLLPVLVATTGLFRRRAGLPRPGSLPDDPPRPAPTPPARP